MKLLEVLPVAFVAVIAGAALLLDDRTDGEGAPPSKLSRMAQAKWFPVDQTLSPNETLVKEEAVPLALAPVIDTARKPEAPAPKRAAKSTGRKEKPEKVRQARAPDAVVVAPAGPVAVARAEVPRSRLQVESRRLGPDERIQLAAMNALARMPNLTGKIAVEARDAVVHLSGWTLTPGQSLRAEKTVARVDGVRSVVNEIRPRMGAVTS